MRKHTKLYMDFFDYGEQDFVMCEMCMQDRAVDIHHIQSRGMGGSKNNAKDFVENLAALCRSCHDKTSNKDFNTKVRIATLRKVADQLESNLDE